MKNILSGLAGFCIVMAPSLQAQELLSEPVPAAYLNVSFGNNAKSTASYGLQLTRVELRTDEGVNLFDNRRPAYFDLKFQSGEIEAISFNGSNLLDVAARYGYNANGDNKVVEWWQGLSTAEKVGIGFVAVLGVGCAVEWCHGDGDSDNGAPPPPPPE